MTKLTRVGILAALTLFLGLAQRLDAQYGESSVMYIPSTGQVMAFTRTVLGYSASYYYDAGVDATWISNGAATYQSALSGSTAEVDFSAPAVASGSYQVIGNHYADAYYTYYTTETYTWDYYDPYCYQEQVPYWNCWWQDNGDGTGQWACELDYYYDWVACDTTGTGTTTTAHQGSQRFSLPATAFSLSLTPVGISILSPSGAYRGSSGTLQINGNFLGAAYDPSFSLSASGLSFTGITATDTQINASYSIGSAATGGPHPFTVTTRLGHATGSFAVWDPVPAITAVTPPGAVQGSNGFTMTVNGTGFVNGSVVRYSNTNLATTFASTTQLTAAMPTYLLDWAFTVAITVVNPNPAPGAAAVSNGITFITGNPVPTLTAVASSPALAGGPDFTLTLTGTNFITSPIRTQVLWNGSSRNTTYVSPTQLTAAITAADVASTGTATLTVANSGPGGGPSNALTLAINNPAPSVSSLSPPLGIVGSSVALVVNGSGFVQGSQVQWNGSNKATTYGSFNQLTATISAADVASTGSANVTVINPTPGGGVSNTTALPINNPTPSATSLSPPSAIVGSGAVAITVIGSNFVSASQVQWNGSNKPTTYVDANHLTAAITSADVSNAGSANVTVINAAPGGGTSSALPFAVNNPVPAITGLVPSPVTAGVAGFLLTVNGAGFLPTSSVQWNGTNRVTSYVSATQLTAAITAGDVASGGTPTVTAVNPAPGGGPSAGMNLTVNNPVPSIGALSPSPATAGAMFALTVTGSGFVGSSTILWNGSSRTTTWVSGTQLTAAITAVDAASAGSATVAVVNPPPAGGTSPGLALTINNPAPALTNISPLSAVVSSGAFTLTLNGSGFVAASQVQWNGSNRTITSVTSTQLKVTINAADIASPGTATVTIVNPTPGGGTSTNVSFTINNPPPVTTIAGLIQATYSGTVYGLNGVTVTATASGSSGGQAQTIGGGYSIGNLTGGATYTLTPSMAGCTGCTFSPSSLTVSQSSTTANFQLTGVTITGNITSLDMSTGFPASPLSGVTVTLGGSQQSPAPTYTTGSDGYFSFTVAPGGSYWVSPLMPNTVIYPPLASFSQVISPQIASQFLAAPTLVKALRFSLNPDPPTGGPPRSATVTATTTLIVGDSTVTSTHTTAMDYGAQMYYCPQVDATLTGPTTSTGTDFPTCDRDSYTGLGAPHAQVTLSAPKVAGATYNAQSAHAVESHWYFGPPDQDISTINTWIDYANFSGVCQPQPGCTNYPDGHTFLALVANPGAPIVTGATRKYPLGGTFTSTTIPATTINTISPATGAASSSVAVTISGTSFGAAGSTPIVTAAGLTVSNVTLIDSNTITATFALPHTSTGDHAVTVTAGTAGSAPSDSKTFTVYCAVPSAFTQTLGRPSPTVSGAVEFVYHWALTPSSANPTDLNVCVIGERSTFQSLLFQGTDDNPTIFLAQSPPFAANPSPPLYDPHVRTTSMRGSGGLADQHTVALPFVAPYVFGTYTATQYYRYSCPCHNNGAWENLIGPILIIRTIDTNGADGWMYTITKSGVTNSINPLP